MIHGAMLFMLCFMQCLGWFTFFRGIYLCSAPVQIKVLFAVLIEIGVFNQPFMLFYCKYFPTWLCLIFGFAGITFVYLTTSTVLMELLRLCKLKNEKIYYFLVTLSIILAFTAYFRSFSQPNIQNITITSKLLKKDCRIVQLSDIHAGPVIKKDWVEKVVKKVNEINPDLVVITGDSMDSFVENGLDNLTPFKNFKSPVYMIMGNHEYYCNAPLWIDAFKKMGIKILQNNHVIIDNNFALGGADWEHNYKNNSDHLIAKTFNGAPQNMPKILLSHYPKSFLEAKAEGVLLQLSGHTHGGMTFPVNFFVSKANGDYLRGLYKEKNSKGEDSFLYVNDGTALWAGMPARLGSSNEITIIDLKRE